MKEETFESSLLSLFFFLSDKDHSVVCRYVI